jgi:hypothetical protein
MAVEQVRVQLDAYDLAELQESIGPDQMAVVEEKPPGALGEPVTLAVLLITPLVLQTLTAWAMKQRRKQELVYRAEVVEASGAVRRCDLKLTFSSSTSSREILQQIADGWKLDPQLVQTVDASLGG